MDVYRRTVFQVGLRANFPSCAKTDCEHLLSSASPPFGVWGQRSVVSGLDRRSEQCNKTRGVIKTVRLSGCQTQLACHTHTHNTLAVSPSQAKQGAHMFEGWLTPGRWFALGRLWSSLSLSLSLSISLLVHTNTHTQPCRHSGVLMRRDHTKPLVGFLADKLSSKAINSAFLLCFLNSSD